MQIFRLFPSLILVLCVQSSFAYQPETGNVTATLGPFVYRTNFSNSNAGVKSPFFGTPGLIVNGDMNSSGSLEVGFFKLNKVYVRELGGQFLSETSENIFIDMGYRYWLNSYFSVSTSLYSSYAMGTTKVIYTDFPTGSEFDTSARDNTEYGLDFSLQTELWRKFDFSVVLDTRYSYCLTAKQNESADHYGALLALKYLIQKK